MAKVFVFPGQGSQHVGMGRDLFSAFPQLIEQADSLLGYSISELCLEDKDKQLRQTQYTQPALYIVNALSYLRKIEEEGVKPDFVAGHSLGEYNALFAAGAFDFITGLKLVQKRGELMGEVSQSSMAAVVGLSADKVRQIIAQEFSTLEVANLNTRTQIVIAGGTEEINSAGDVFQKAGGRYVILNVSAAFHSNYMSKVKEKFSRFIANFSFASLKIPVISNYTAQPYQDEETAQNLIEQITASVRWQESMEYLLRQAEPEFEEVGPKKVLTGLLAKIRKEYKPSSETSVPPIKQEKNIIFMFSGQGTQYYHMGKELYENDETFRGSMDDCDKVVKEILGTSIVEILYQERENRFEGFSLTSYTHPAIFMFGYSLTQVILKWGVSPDYLLGYSLGEYVANVIGGALSLEDGLRAVIEQGILVEKYTPEATIFAVLASPDILEKYPSVFANTWLAGRNFPKNFTLTVPEENIAEVTVFFKEQSISFQQLPVSRGFHSPLIDEAKNRFKDFAQKLKIAAPATRIVSPVLGGDLAEVNTEYLWNTVRQPVELSQTLDFLEERSEKNIYIDIGPAGSMATAVKYNCPATENPPIVTINAFGKNLQSLKRARDLIASY